jgi:hypothetical protein
MIPIPRASSAKIACFVIFKKSKESLFRGYIEELKKKWNICDTI